MKLLPEIARQIINLNPAGQIDPDIARRQFEVIVKGFNYLTQSQNDFLYIADEVGLGKTYVALGIASLMRYYSEHPQTHTDMILVPKQNLQFKWQKEIRQFITHNFLQESNRVKSAIGLPVGRCEQSEIHEDLRTFGGETPTYQIFRTTSFSLARQEEKGWINRLAERLAPQWQLTFMDGARQLKNNEEKVRRLFGYLMNCSLPEVDLLIVDEAHNFKHGINGEVSYRNQVTSRVMGIIQEDIEIFRLFPELRPAIKRKAKKVIFLSATPIDRGLYEVKNQMDCFFPQHRFSHINDQARLNECIQEALPAFLIRGVMSIKLREEKAFTRNMYRQEHRNGNVRKDNLKAQKIDDDFQSMVIGLLQYKTIKELNLNHGNHFEIGMLAGFESFAESSSEKEYEQTATREERKSKDEHVVRKIAESYYKKFNQFLPHPKQDKLVEVLKPYLERGEKALIFVRRIASVKEFERKLLREYEQLIVKKIHSLQQKENPRIQQLVRLYQEQKDHEELESTLQLLAGRMAQYDKQRLAELLSGEYDEDEAIEPILLRKLLDIYEGEEAEEISENFRQLTRKHFRRRSIDTVYRESALELLFDYQHRPVNDDEDNDPDEEDQKEERSNYFFDRFFMQKQGPGGKFRKRSYDQDWYNLNYYLINRECAQLHWAFDASKLQKVPELKESETKRAIKKFEARQEGFRDALRNPKSNQPEQNIHEDYRATTFLTDLLLGPCRDAFSDWVDRHIKNEPDKIEQQDYFFEHLDILTEILRGVFRNGSGRLPAYLADCIGSDHFTSQLLDLIETTFPLVLKEVNTILNDFENLCRQNFPDIHKLKRMMYQQVPVMGLSGHHRRDVSKTAAQFRMPGFPYILVATDIVKEGEDLHSYCKDVFHYGIAWNPSDMEQRTGRIDRIGSYCYRMIKDKPNIAFEDKIHVFFPYLADTLEVNQVVKVFQAMNQFIETFYDFSRIPDRDHRAAVDTLVGHIPEPIETRLQSKYDHQHFIAPLYEEASEGYQVREVLGVQKGEILEKLKRLANDLEDQFDFFLKPDLRASKFEISGTINLNGRRAPFLVKVVNEEHPGSFVWLIRSYICNTLEIKHRADHENIATTLKEGGLKLEYDNQMLVAQEKIDFDTDNLVKKLSRVCVFADELEKSITGDTDSEVVF